MLRILDLVGMLDHCLIGFLMGKQALKVINVLVLGWNYAEHQAPGLEGV